MFTHRWKWEKPESMGISPAHVSLRAPREQGHRRLAEVDAPFGCAFGRAAPRAVRGWAGPAFAESVGAENPVRVFLVAVLAGYVLLSG